MKYEAWQAKQDARKARKAAKAKKQRRELLGRVVTIDLTKGDALLPHRVGLCILTPYIVKSSVVLQSTAFSVVLIGLSACFL